MFLTKQIKLQYKKSKQIKLNIDVKEYTKQGYNAKKVISEVYASFVLQCILSLGGNVNTRRMSKPDMGSIFHKKNQ